MEMLIDILKVLGLLIVGAVIGFFIAKKYMMKYLEKNPPINEEMIKTLMGQMGRKPNQKQINQIMKQMQNMWVKNDKSLRLMSLFFYLFLKL